MSDPINLGASLGQACPFCGDGVIQLDESGRHSQVYCTVCGIREDVDAEWEVER